MPDTRTATLRAVQAAGRLHKEYRAREMFAGGVQRIDVFRMLIAQEIPLLFRPLGGLLGAYFDGSSSGIVITTERRLPIQRFTAAHELGHRVLKHHASLDDESILARTPFADSPLYDLQEIQADAFASELLMPQWILAGHVKRQGWRPEDLRRPEIVYQLSLRLGVSYRALCQSLKRHRIVPASVRDALISLRPREIKRSLLQGIEPETFRSDVWVLSERDDGLLLEGDQSDFVVLQLREHSGSGYLWKLDELVPAGFVLIHGIRTPVGDEQRIGGILPRTVTAQANPVASGVVTLSEIRPWLPDSKPLATLRMAVDLSGPLRAGLHPFERRALLGVT